MLRHAKSACELMSAQLHRDSSGISCVLRAGVTKRSWRERIGIAPRTVYSSTIPPRNEAGAYALARTSSGRMIPDRAAMVMTLLVVGLMIAVAARAHAVGRAA